MTKEQTIVSYYKNLIKENVLQKGAMLPVEKEICQMFNASRMTVRKAMDRLVEQGWLYRISGKGTFVSQIAVEDAYGLQGLSLYLSQMGIKTESQVLAFEQVELAPHISWTLRIPPGGRAYHLKRLRFADQKAIALESAYLSQQRFPNLERFDFSTESLYRVLRDEYSSEIIRCSQTICTADVSGETAQYLFQAGRATAMKAVNLGYDKQSSLIAYEEAYYNGYEYSFRVIIRKD